MDFNLTLSTKTHSATSDGGHEDYDGILVTHRISEGGDLTIRVQGGGANQVAFRSSLANAMISLTGEMKACGVPQDCLPSARIRTARGVILLSRPGQPFEVGRTTLDEAGIIFLAAEKLRVATREGAVEQVQ